MNEDFIREGFHCISKEYNTKIIIIVKLTMVEEKTEASDEDNPEPEQCEHCSCVREGCIKYQIILFYFNLNNLHRCHLIGILVSHITTMFLLPKSLEKSVTGRSEIIGR